MTDAVDRWGALDPQWTGRTTPEWFRDAKFGIFVHWGPYSVPGWAPLSGSFDDVEHLGWEHWFANCSYAEWYANTMRFPDSPTARYHTATWGDQPYSAFGRMFDRRSQQWSVDDWGDLFAGAGARYVVLTTKHHDGYCLWPSEVANPYEPAWSSTRDLTGELAQAVRARGLRFGTYYSGGLDWSWLPTRIRNQQEVFSTFPQSDEYITYLDAQWRELIDRYAPDILWNDIGTPANQDLHALFADYFAAVPDGVINSRFGQRDDTGNLVLDAPFDMTNPEYTAELGIAAIPFETCRGIGHSFGYNRLEDASTFATSRELIDLLIDVVCRNGNLLLNVGPAADGSIQEAQQERLRDIGAWLQIYGEAIYGTRPWLIASLPGNNAVRFTGKTDSLYVMVSEHAEGEAVVLPGVELAEVTIVTDLRTGDILDSSMKSGSAVISGLTSNPAASAFRIEPAPVLLP